MPTTVPPPDVLGRDLRTEVLLDPQRSLTAPQRSALLAELREVVSTLPGAPLTYGVFSSRGDELEGAVISATRDRRSGRIASFSAMRVIEGDWRGRWTRVVHVGLTVTRPEYRGTGVTWRVSGRTLALLLIKNGLRPYWVSNVSQVPSAIGMFAQGPSEVCRNPLHPDASPSGEHRDVAAFLMQARSAFGVGDEAWLDADRLIIRNSYTGGSDGLKKTWDEVPKHRDHRVNDLCRRELDYERGDDYLQIGRIDLKAAVRCLRAAVRSSLRAHWRTANATLAQLGWTGR